LKGIDSLNSSPSSINNVIFAYLIIYLLLLPLSSVGSCLTALCIVVFVGVGVSGEHETSVASQKWSFFFDDDGIFPVTLLEMCPHAVPGLVVSFAQQYWAIHWYTIGQGNVVCSFGCSVYVGYAVPFSWSTGYLVLCEYVVS
jgi:hypothetical protein